MNQKDHRGPNMEVHFPHLTNSIARVTPTRRQRAKVLRKVLWTAGICGSLLLSVSYAFAHPEAQASDQDAMNGKKTHLCLHLEEILQSDIDDINRHKSEENFKNYSKAVKRANDLAPIFGHYCK